jgi:acyl-CoA thioesterase-1
MHQGNVLRCAAVSAAATALLLAAAAATAWAQSPGSVAPRAIAPKCVVAPDQAHFDLPLARTALRISGGLPVKIVAIGSSSTYGAGASSPARSYPSRLEVELRRHFPGHALTVLNRGANGEEASDMLGRFQSGVIAESPHLVLWQVGTNSVLHGRPVDPHVVLLEDGIARLKAIRADVVLINPQFAPKVIAKIDAESMVDLIAATAKAEKVDLFDRFAMMRRWREVERLPFETFVSPDGLHMNDWSYGCLAKWLGVAIADAATRPAPAMATRRPGR